MLPYSWIDAERINAAIDGLDQVAQAMERKWGVGRLELLVDDELRYRFRIQLHKLDNAIALNDVGKTQIHAAAMQKAWVALDQAATATGGLPIVPEVWEIVLPDGRVVAFTRSNAEAANVIAQGRYVETWTVAEVANVIANFPEVATAKQIFPGATVVSARPKRQPLNVATGDDIPF